MHLGQVGDDLGLQLDPKLDEELLGRRCQVLPRLDQGLQGVVLAVGGRLGLGPGEVPLGLFHRAAGGNQIFLESDPGIADPAGDLGKRVGRLPVAGLVALELAEAVLGNVGLGLAQLRVERGQLLLEELQGLTAGVDRLAGVVGFEEGGRILDEGDGPRQQGGLNLVEGGRVGQGVGRFPDARLPGDGVGDRLVPGGAGLVFAGPGRRLDDRSLFPDDRPEILAKGAEPVEFLGRLGRLSRPGQLALFFLDDSFELPERLAHLAEPGELELEIEILGQQEAPQVFELRQELPDLGLGPSELGRFEQLGRLPHLLEDRLVPGELQGQSEPRRVLRFEPQERLGEPEHPLLQLGHLGRCVLLGEADRPAFECGGRRAVPRSLRGVGLGIGLRLGLALGRIRERGLGLRLRVVEDVVDAVLGGGRPDARRQGEAGDEHRQQHRARRPGVREAHRRSPRSGSPGPSRWRRESTVVS